MLHVLPFGRSSYRHAQWRTSRGEVGDARSVICVQLRVYKILLSLLVRRPCVRHADIIFFA